jgi:hypothetical protein
LPAFEGVTGFAAVEGVCCGLRCGVAMSRKEAKGKDGKNNGRADGLV